MSQHTTFFKEKDKSYSFLPGGGKMGDLIRSWDWTNTSIGSIDHWPLSLRTTLGIVLHSAFPMILYWGKDRLCFYNDAFKPSLGEKGKSPLVGSPGESRWRETLDIVDQSWIKQVFETGESRWFEDQLIQHFRDGQTGNAYWTFSCSPAFGDTGEVAGVLVTCIETTQKVVMVKKLLESETRFQTLVREATVGIIVLEGKEMMVKIVNDEYGKLIDRKASELINRPLFSIIPEAEIYFRHILDKVRETGEPIYLYDYPYFIYLNDTKKEGFLNIVYLPYREDDGGITGVMVLCQDVTGQVLARKKAEESEQQVRSLVESAPFPIAVYEGREMRIVLANQAIIDAWGKGSDVIGKLYSEVLPELDNQEIFGQLHEVYDTGIPYHARNRRVDLFVDGKMQSFYFNYSFTPIYDAAGKIYGVMNTAAETTDLNLAKQRIEQSEQNFRNMILQAPVAMCILLGPTHIIEIANQQMIKIWGKTAFDVAYKPIFEALPDAKEQGLEQLLRAVYQTGIPFTANERPGVLERNGKLETVFQNFVYEPYRDGDGKILGVLVISVDVTEQVLARQKIEEKVAERTQELAAANTSLQRSNDELAQFAYIASHDLQEPLRKVTSFADLLERNLGHINDKTRSYLDKINASTARMAALIRDVLAYSQLSKESIGFKRVDLEKIIADIKTDMELLIEQKKATIVTEGLPVISAIPLQMSQLFDNLLSNALKFTRPGQSPLIKIRAKQITPDEVTRLAIQVQPTPYYLIEMEDNGIGFNPEHAEQIFNIFQRLHSMQEYSGTGIGLAICKKIAQNHRGDIFASSMGKGAVFSIILPAEQSA